MKVVMIIIMLFMLHNGVSRNMKHLGVVIITDNNTMDSIAVVSRKAFILAVGGQPRLVELANGEL